MYLLLNIVRLIITRCFWPCCMQPLLCTRTLRIRFLEFISKNSLPSMGWIKCIITSNLTSSALESNYSTVLSTPSQQTSAFLLYIDQIKSFEGRKSPSMVSSCRKSCWEAPLFMSDSSLHLQSCWFTAPFGGQWRPQWCWPHLLFSKKLGSSGLSLTCIKVKR